jgi:hypothetical protein
MTRLLALFLFVGGLFLVTVGCGGSNETTVIEPPSETEVSETEKEAESAEYEQAMSEMQ